MVVVTNRTESHARGIELIRVFGGVKTIGSCVFELRTELEVQPFVTCLRVRVHYFIIGVGRVPVRAVIGRRSVYVPVVCITFHRHTRIHQAVLTGCQLGGNGFGVRSFDFGLGHNIYCPGERVYGIVCALQHLNPLNQQRVYRDVHRVVLCLRVSHVDTVQQHFDLLGRTAPNGRVHLYPTRPSLPHIDTRYVLQQICHGRYRQ